MQTVDRGGTAHGRVGISMFHSTPFFYDGARKLQAHCFSLGEAAHIHTCIVAVPAFQFHALSRVVKQVHLVISSEPEGEGNFPLHSVYWSFTGNVEFIRTLPREAKEISRGLRGAKSPPGGNLEG